MKKIIAAALVAVSVPAFANEAAKPAEAPKAEAKKTETKKDAKKDAKAAGEHHDEAAPAAGHK